MNAGFSPSDRVEIIKAVLAFFGLLVPIITTVISSRKKTQESIEAMSKKLTDDINSTKKEVKDLQKDFEEHVEEAEEHRAKQARYRILRFYDEICEGKQHSESHYEDVIDDIDFYEAFCEAHKDDFKNNRGEVAMKYIKQCYEEDKIHGMFLTHREEKTA